MKPLECTNCEEPITEPLCAVCFVNQVEAWLREQPISSLKADQAKIKLGEWLDAVGFLSYGMKCVICNTNMRTLCSYCVMKEARSIVGSSVGSRSLSQFQEVFNSKVYEYGLHH